MITKQCRWHPCGQEATHDDPPLCDEHHEQYQARIRGPRFQPPQGEPT